MQLRINEHDARVIEAEQIGAARVRVVLQVPLSALLAGRQSVGPDDEMVLDLLDLSPHAASLVVDALRAPAEGFPK